jgi:DNA-binding SARP family transcriptional activator/tetratricopeptide (TPR) repeat protein
MPADIRGCAVRFEVLGPMRIVGAQGARPVAGARQRTVLAALLANANRPVPVEALVETVWDGAPPDGAAVSLRAHIMRLRRGLGVEAGARIRTYEAGYLVEVREEELDAAEFEALCRQVGDAIRDHAWTAASATATRALDLWHGPPLADVSSQTLRESWVPQLDQMRLQAVEWRIEAELRLGRHSQLIATLRGLTAEHPLREHFHAQLMLALARDGRQAEALEAYRKARRYLIDQLGIEPGLELRELQERILAGVPESQAEAAGQRDGPPASAPAAPATVPRQLPASVRHFAGRTRELKTLTGLMTHAAAGGNAVVISAIGGLAGVGKTALAVHWAQQHADRFPDGQLYVNLRGFGPSAVPLSPEVAVRGFLDGLGVPAARIPPDLDAQVALYRSSLAGRRVLVVLDNARNAEQVRPLLPGSATCLALVTSRDRLTGLVAADGAVPVALNLLTPDEARELLTRRLGAERVALEYAAVEELIELCARLPLALNIVSARAAAYPDLALSEIARGLRGARQLDSLATGDSAADARAAFSWSYRALDPATAQAFRLVSLVPGPDFGAQAAAAPLNRTPREAESALESLVDAGLLQNPLPGRYRFHDLLRAYAAERADADEPAEVREARTARICGWYLRAAVEAARLISPDRRLPELEDSPETEPPPSFADYDAAVAWSDGEYANLIAVIDAAERDRRHEVVWKLAIALWDVFNLRGRFADLIDTHRRALVSARALRDRAAEGWLLSHLSVAYSTVGSPEAAIECLQQALEIDKESGNRRSEAVNLVNLGFAYFNQQQFEQAVETFQAALTASRETGHWRAEAAAINNIGSAYKNLGRLDEALEYTTAALATHREHGDRQAEASTCASIAEIMRLRGERAEAFVLCDQALRLSRAAGIRQEEANVLATLGYLHLAEGRVEEARRHWRKAEEIFREIDASLAADIRAELEALE